MYMHNNHCHRVTAHLQSNILFIYLEGREHNTTSPATLGFTENIRIISDPSYTFYFV